MLHKLIITSAIAFIPFQWQLPGAMIVVCLYGAALYVFKPYVRKSDDRLHLVSLTEIIMLLMSGNVFNNNDYDPLYDWLMSIILIILVILFFVFFVLQALQALYKLVKEWRKNQGRKKQAAMTAAGNGDTIDDDAPLTSGTAQ
jgi:CDP-diglyceride synthetase